MCRRKSTEVCEMQWSDVKQVWLLTDFVSHFNTPTKVHVSERFVSGIMLEM